MGFAYQALFTLAGLACSVLVAVGLADNRPDATPAESSIVLAEATSAESAAAEAGFAEPGAEYQPEDEALQEPATQTARRAHASSVVVRRICRVTAYDDRGTTASGAQAGVGQCAAPIDIPFGSRIYIPALHRTLVVTDRTHPRFRHNTVDIFLPREQQCLNFGCRYLKCEITFPDQATATRLGR